MAEQPNRYKISDAKKRYGASSGTIRQAKDTFSQLFDESSKDLENTGLNTDNAFEALQLADLATGHALEDGIVDANFFETEALKLSDQAKTGDDLSEVNAQTINRENQEEDKITQQQIADNFETYTPTDPMSAVEKAEHDAKVEQFIAAGLDPETGMAIPRGGRTVSYTFNGEEVKKGDDFYFLKTAFGQRHDSHRTAQKRGRKAYTKMIAGLDPELGDDYKKSVGHYISGRAILGTPAEDILAPPTPEESERVMEGWWDGYITSIMFLPNIIHGFSSESGDAELAEWKNYIDSRASDDIFYKAGMADGDMTGMVIDPISEITLFGAFKAIKGLWKGTKATGQAVQTAGALKSSLGKDGAVGLLSTSHQSLVRVFSRLLNSNPKVMRKLIQDTTGRTDQVSMKLRRALDEAMDVTEDAARNKIVKEGTKSETSAAAQFSRVADNDPMASDKLKEGILAHSAEETTGATKEILEEAFDMPSKTAPLLPNIPRSGVSHPVSDYGRQMNNAAEVSGVVTDSLYMRILKENMTIIDDVHSLRVYKREVSSGVTAHGWDGGTSLRLVNAFLPPSMTFKGLARRDFVITPTANLQETKRLQKAFSEDMRVIWSGLTKEESSSLGRAIAAGNESGNWLRPVGGGLVDPKTGAFHPMTDRAKASYRQRKYVMDDVRTLVNEEARKQAHSNDFRLLNIGDGDSGLAKLDTSVKPQTTSTGGDVVYRVEAGFDEAGNVKKSEVMLSEPVEWTQELAESHDVYTLFKKTGDQQVGTRVMVPKAQTTGLVKDIPKGYPLMGDANGFMHVSYTGKYAVTRVVTDKAGDVSKVERVAMADNYVDGQSLIKQWDRPDKGIHHIVDLAENGQYDLAYSGAFGQMLDTMSDTQLVALQKQMIDSGVSAEAVTQYMDAQKKFMFRAGGAMKKRAAERLLDAKKVLSGRDGMDAIADIVPAKEADALYLDWAARYTGEATHTVALEKGFIDSYGTKGHNILENPENAFSGFREGADSKMVDEALTYQDQLRKLTGRRSQFEIRADQLRKNFIDKLFIKNKNKNVSYAGDFLDSHLVPTYGGFFRSLKALTGTAKLSLFSVIQMPLQFSAGFLNVVGSQTGRLLFKGDRRATLKAMASTQTDFVKYISPNILKASDVPGAKGARQVWDLVQRSGIDAGMDYEHLARLTGDVKNLRALTGGGSNIGAAIVKGKRALATGAEKSGIFFQIGETFQQVYSFLGAKNMLEVDIKAGRHATLTIADITGRYSDDFLEEAMKHGKVLALDMSRVNQPGLLKGEAGSTVFLFKQFGLKQGALFNPFGKHLSGAEKAGLWLTWAGVYGLNGIPFGWDMAIGAEELANLAGVPDAKGMLTTVAPLWAAEQIANKMKAVGFKSANTEFIFRWATQGVDSALSEGELVLGHRMAIGEYWSSYVDGANVDEMMLGAAYATAKNLFKNDLPLSAEVLVAAIKEGSLDSDDRWAALLIATKQLSGPNAHLRAARAFRTGELRSSTGKLYEKNPSLSTLIQTAIGIQAGDISTATRLQRLKYTRKKVIMDWIKDKANSLSEVKIHSDDAGEQLLLEARAELEDAGYPLASVTLLTAVINKDINSNLDLRTRMQLEAIQDFELNRALDQALDIELEK